MIIDEEVYLEHYGVKGMRWGVRKDRQSGADRREAKAKKYEEKANKIQGRIDQLSNQKSRTAWERQANIAIRDDLSQQKEKNLKAAKDTREGRLTDGQKKALKGAAVTAAIVGAYGAYSLAQSGQFNSMSMKGRAFLSGESLFKRRPELTKVDMDVDELMTSVVSKINPDYGGLGTKMNCRRCTFAYEMRRRGYDVAATKTTDGHGQSVLGMFNATKPGKPDLATGRLATIYKLTRAGEKDGDNPLTRAVRTRNPWGDVSIEPDVGGLGGNVSGRAIFKALSTQRDRSRGEIGVGWRIGGGHSLAYEIVNNRPVIFDTQSGKRFLTPEAFERAFSSEVVSAGFTRLDDLPLNPSFLARWLKHA